MELSKEQMEKIINANNKVVECYNELSKARKELWNAEKDLTEGEWRNTKMSYWKDICAKYPEEKLLNCYGDIFYIDERHIDKGFYVGRRVLWNLSLSNEQYYIEEIVEVDSDGEYDYTDYVISIKE